MTYELISKEKDSLEAELALAEVEAKVAYLEFTGSPSVAYPGTLARAPTSRNCARWC